MHVDKKTEVLSKFWALPFVPFKQSLRRFWYRHNNPLYALNLIIKESREVTEGIFVELVDGTKFMAPREHLDYTLSWIENADPMKWNKIEKPGAHVSLVAALCDMYVRQIYSRREVRLSEGDVVCDLGAEIGLFTMWAAKLVGGGGLVIAVEPEENNLRFLQKNCSINGIHNVVVVPKGVWSRKDRLPLYLYPVTSGHSLLDRKDTTRFVDVDVDTLDNILEAIGIERVDFIKMNIESAEIEAVKGMKETLQKPCKLAIGAHHILDGKETHKVLGPLLRREGFQVSVTRKTVYAFKAR